MKNIIFKATFLAICLLSFSFASMSQSSCDLTIDDPTFVLGHTYTVTVYVVDVTNYPPALYSYTQYNVQILTPTISLSYGIPGDTKDKIFRLYVFVQKDGTPPQPSGWGYSELMNTEGYDMGNIPVTVRIQ